MQSSHLETCFHSPSINLLPNTPLSPIRCHKIYYTKFLVKKKCSLNAQVQVCPVRSSISSAPSMIDKENTSDFWQWYEEKLGFEPYEKKFPHEGGDDGSSSCDETHIDKASKERDRRKKIGLANKGRVPWNKGKKHTPETRERISEKTKEALMDPKVKKKIKECRRAHSEQTKERIGSSVRKLWAEKLKSKRSRAKYLSIWAENIAEAARRGGCDQEELDWDSYEKIKEKNSIEEHKWANIRAEEKEKEKLAVEQRKKERTMRLAQKKEEQEQRAKVGGGMKRKTTRKSKEEREEMFVANGLKLKERLTKIHRRKISGNGQISGEDQQTWEKLDLEFIKAERRKREFSLADQIQAAKTKRTELYNEKSPACLSEKSAK